MMNLLTSLAIALSLLLPAIGARAADERRPTGDSAKAACEKALGADGAANGGSHISAFIIKESPRAPEDARKYREYVKELVQPGGIIERLGIRMTGQVVEFVIPRDLNALTSGSAGGYPISHYLDGAAVLKSMNPRAGFALEVVYPGPNYQHGFYRDDNDYSQQISIIDHVVGHNNFALTSGLEHYRVGQGLEHTKAMDKLLRSLYEGFDKDQVQRYYLWLMTLMPLVDWYGPHFQPSKDFEPKLDVSGWDPLGRTRPTIQRHPKAPTENVLPAFAANLAPNEPTWKRQLMEHMIVSMGFRPALVHTQIMNEGWASIMQEILPAHSNGNHNFKFWMRASQVMQTERMPKLTDPYSLGVACWRRLREKFNSRPEIREMKTLIEKDRAFIAYAEEIIRKHTDEQFLRLAMDQVFVDRYKLAVIRKAGEDEQDIHLPPPRRPSQEPIAQWLIVSRDADKVAQMVINKVLKPKYFFNPRVKLIDFTRPGTGEVELRLDDEAGRAFPLKTDTLAPSLYALANIIGKPVSLEGTLLEQASEFPDWAWNLPAHVRQMYAGLFSAGKAARARITVSPVGDVRVYKILSEYRHDSPEVLAGHTTIREEKLDESMTKEHQGKLKEYIDDLYLEDDTELDRIYSNSESLRKMTQEIVQTVIESSPYDGIVSQAPNAAGAIMEYKSILERRMAKALERAIKKKGGIQVGPRGARVRALPSAVEIEYDREFIQTMMKDMPIGSSKRITNLNRTLEKATTPAPMGPFDPDESGSGRVGPIDGNPGDRFWGPGDPDGGPGQAGTQPGEDPNDLSWVDIPEELYSRFLNERVKLPILNKKPGLSKTRAKKPGGRIARPQGQTLPHEVIVNALNRGIGAVAADGGDPMDDIQETFDRGFDSLQPRDIIVKNTRPTKRPDIKAVVTFVLDASASTEKYYEAFKRFVNDMEALVRANYKGFDFRYIVFDTDAHVMKNRTEFFKARLGGGTRYKVGIERAHKLFNEEYPRSKWDRYTFVLGDMEDFGTTAVPAIKNLLEDSEYFGTVAGIYQDPSGLELLQAIMAEAQSNEGVGYTILDQDGGYKIENMREVLRNEPE